MGVDLDLLDDIFSDEVVTAVKRPSKFQPKSKLRPPPKNPPTAPEINKSRAQETSDAAPSGNLEAETANPLNKNCDSLPEDNGVLHSSIEKSQGETAGILSGLENVGDFVPYANTPNMGGYPPPESELVAVNDSNPVGSQSDFGPLAATESAISTGVVYSEINDKELRTEEMVEAIGSSEAANVTSESGLGGIDFQPDLCLDNPFDAEKYPSSTFQRDDVLDLASLGFPDPLPSEADPNIQSNLDSGATHMEPPSEAPSKLETRRAETRTGNAEENETGRSLRPRKKKQNESRSNDKGAAARKRNVPEETCEPNPTKPKRFSHSSRRRRVNRELLETPEDEIDYQKLSLRDLILLGEHKEKQMKKEEATAGGTSQERQGGTTTERENEDGEGDAAVEDANLYFNYQTYMDKPRPIRWSKQDTEMFYEAIRQFGTDLSLIQQLFPGLTRQQIKLKYKKEERQHPFRLHEAVTNRSKDHSHFKRVIERLQQMAAEQNKKEEDEEEEDLITGEMSEGCSRFKDGESKDEEKDHDEDVSNECVEARPEEEEDDDDDDVIDWSQYKTL